MKSVIEKFNRNGKNSRGDKNKFEQGEERNNELEDISFFK